jgi:hypothetical protein
LVACLLALSAWPAAVSHRAFNGIEMRSTPQQLSISEMNQAMAQFKANPTQVVGKHTIVLVDAKDEVTTFTLP